MAVRQRRGVRRAFACRTCRLVPGREQAADTERTRRAPNHRADGFAAPVGNALQATTPRRYDIDLDGDLRQQPIWRRSVCGTRFADPREVRAVAATHTPESQTPLPATQFHLFGPSGEPPLMYVRTIDVGRFDSGRWEFHASGAVQPFEDTEAYERRRIRDRFTRTMLLDYLSALGIRADEPGFYTSGILATDTGSWSPGWTATLAEARASLT